jgi:hypothetical protein
MEKFAYVKMIGLLKKDRDISLDGKRIFLSNRKKREIMRSIFLRYGLWILLLSSLSVACKKAKRTDDARKIVSEERTGKQIESAYVWIQKK